MDCLIQNILKEDNEIWLPVITISSNITTYVCKPCHKYINRIQTFLSTSVELLGASTK